MEVKTILEKIRQKENQPSEYYFALEIGREFIKSAVFSIEENQVEVVSLGDRERWENEEELIEAVDASLSSAAEKLPVKGEVKEPDKVVFGLPSAWVEGDKIVANKLKLLKNLSEKLDLKPAGFVVITEAIVYHLKTTEGIPLTAILVNLGLKKIGVSLVKIGKILGPKLIDKSDNLADDLVEGLSRFKIQEPLPARILLCNSGDQSEEVRQQLVSYPWLEEKKEAVEFLHLPKVEVLPVYFDIEAIALAGGKEVAKAAGLVLEEKPAEEKGVVKKEVEEKPVVIEEKPGFVAAEELGFVKGKDVAEKEVSVKPELPRPEVAVEKAVEKGAVLTKMTLFAKLCSFRPSFSWLGKINLTFLRELIPNLLRMRLTLVLVIGLFLIFIGSLFAAYWYLPQAEVTLYLEPEMLAKDFTIKLDPNASTPDKENFVLPARQIEVEVENKKSRVTTGSKEIGDPAKGEVTVYNGTSNEKTFKAETKITSLAGLEFTFDDEVKVASQSSAAEPPGKAVVKVTATKIGTEGNLTAGTEFTIANYAKSDYVAKNDSAFSGGTSRQIQAVSEEDQKTLLADLETSLEKEAREKLVAQLSLEQKLIEESIANQVVNKDYDHQIGDETENLELTLKLKSSALVYTEQELRDLVEDKILESITEGFNYQPEETEFSFDLEKVNEDGSVTVKSHLEAKLTPQLDLEQIKKNLAGKYIVIGRAYLNNLPKVTGFEEKIIPRLPGRFGTFPRVAKKIEIKLKIQ